MINCTEFDNLYNDIVAHVSTTSQIFWISSATFSLLFSLLMVFAGEKLFRPASALIAGVTGLVLGYMITTEMGDVKCYIKLIVSGIFALVLCIAVSCLLKAGLFLLGGASFGAVAHYSFEIVPEDILPNIFAFQNKNGLYWIVVLSSGLIGATLSLIYQKKFMRIATSMIGGSGIAFCIHIFCYELTKPPLYVHPGVLLVITILLSCFGYLFQTQLSKKRKNKDTKGIEKEIESIKNVNKNKIDKRYISELLRQTQIDTQLEAREAAKAEIMREIQRNKYDKSFKVIDP